MAKHSKIIPGFELSLSSVKVFPPLLSRFQKDAFHILTFQSLVNRALFLYCTDESFKNTIISCNDLLASGSL